MPKKQHYQTLEKPLLLARPACREPALWQAAGTLISVFSRPAPGKETENEDCVALIPVHDSGVVIAVADGVGGLPQGAAASELALQSVISCMATAASPREGILEGIELANRSILERSVNFATTLAVVEIEGDSLRTYHIGDSGIVLTGQRGRIKLETNPHSPTGDGVRGGFLEPLDALQHEDRNIVSNVIGSQEMHIEVGSPTRIAPRDTGLVASDGLFDNLLSGEIVETIRRGPLHRATQTLIDFATRRMDATDTTISGHPDDLSVVLFRKSP
ncbi:MAG: protein phosphatase 2C domain-containing protein [Thiogranum sp.]|nr:protein phosphatase 2C domain-containing protein [Thiogranum sp.]